MNVEVRLYGALRRYRPPNFTASTPNPFPIALPVGATVATLAAWLGIPDGVVSAVAVNDVAVESDVVLREGDRVSLFPPAAGGFRAAAAGS